LKYGHRGIPRYQIALYGRHRPLGSPGARGDEGLLSRAELALLAALIAALLLGKADHPDGSAIE
jgi:hypothetical protein